MDSVRYCGSLLHSLVADCDTRPFFASARLLNELRQASLLQCPLGFFCCSLTLFIFPMYAAYTRLCASPLSGMLLFLYIYIYTSICCIFFLFFV
ncbi:hypothetical protein MOQ_006133, partial [Trypanosoma cruzi marinkellei]